MSASFRRWAGIRTAFMLLAVAVLPGLSCALDSGSRVAPGMQAAGPLRIGASNLNGPPRPGENAIEVVVQDSSGRPVGEASVEVTVSMPSMGAMPRMESRGRTREVKPGVYRTRYGLAMNGEWDVTVSVHAKTGAEAQVSYRLSTSAPGLSFEGGTEALGNAAPARAPRDTGLTGVVNIDAARRQAIGIRVAPVTLRELSTRIRAAGRVAYDEQHVAEVALKFSGFVREIAVDFTGRRVRAGEELFRAYSPELWSAQQEYLEALRAARADSSSLGGGPEAELAEAARRRLALWDLTPAEIDDIARAGRPREAIPIVSPVSGVVTEKSVVRGSPFSAGQVIYRIAPLDPAWVIASVYQMDLPQIRTGMTALLTDPDVDQRSRRGVVSFVAPSLDNDTHAGQVRIEVPNPNGTLKPGAFVTVELEAALGRRLAVPESAVLPTGERHLVFVDLGDGRFAPREVRLGARAGEYFEVLEGLRAGELVVTAGNFMVAAESKLRSAAGKW